MELTRYDVLGRPEDVAPVLDAIRKYTEFNQDPKSPQFYVLVGGDGTVTWKQNKEKLFRTPKVPILHVHYREDSVKTQGFAADVYSKNLDIALKDIIDGHYVIQKEKLLDCIINGEKKDTAINDIAIRNEENFSTLLFDAVIDTGNCEEILRKKTLVSPKCDMFLICTPYGSTAWYLSIGGSIHVDSDCMGIGITNIPIKQGFYTTKLKYVLSVRVHCNALVGIDGNSSVYDVKESDEITITQSKRRLKLIRTKNTIEDLDSKIERQIEFSKRSIMRQV